MGHVRTVEEQRAYMASSVVKRQDKHKGKAYVENGKLHVTGKCTLSRYELATIMAQMG